MTIRRRWKEIARLGLVKNDQLDLNDSYYLEIKENQDGLPEPSHGGKREGAGRPPKYECKPEYFKSHFTGESEWTTPVEYIRAASGRIGEIDLDPARIIEAQLQANAARYFAKSDNALVRFWSGRVWLNPPYAQPHFLDSFKSWFLS